jgi:hypothetical protein
MITSYKEITTDSPTKEIWKHLRYFLDVKAVDIKIRNYHKVPDGKYTSDTKKQARQISYSIRQAEEFFIASSQVGIPTRPLLLYYGAVSLSRALLMIRKDGNYCYDSLRKKKKHNHHGLVLCKKCVSELASPRDIASFLKAIRFKIYMKKDSSGGEEPWGSFPLFYSCLVPGEFTLKQTIKDSGKTTYIETTTTQTTTDKLAMDVISQREFNALDLMKTLPDMFYTLNDMSIPTTLCRGNVESRIIKSYKKNPDGKEEPEKYIETFNFFLDGITQVQKKKLLDFYAKVSPNIKTIADYGANIHLQMLREDFPGESPTSYYAPDIVEDSNCTKFYILEPVDYLPEPATYLALLFCFGMLSRYYPDIWMKIIDENVLILEAIDTFLNFAYRKYPALILDQMTHVRHNIHV